MRTLSPAPPSITFGSFKGALPRVEWGAVGVLRIIREKSWLYIAVASDEVWLSLAILRTGYAATILAYVFDRKSGRMIFEKTEVRPAPVASVCDDIHGFGLLARYGKLRIERTGNEVAVRGVYGGLSCDFTLDESTAPPGIVAAVEFAADGLRSATEKRALATVRGTIEVDGKRFTLDGATAGWDFTSGLLPRHTKWRWGFGLGRDIAFNLVEGFIGEAECALFSGREVLPLAEPYFSFDSVKPTDPWRIAGEGIDLRFEVGAVHSQQTDLLIVRSRFLQAVGTYHGMVGGRPVNGVPGVVEDQDVYW